MSLRLSEPKCPTCGELARGTIERLAGVAEFEENEQGALEYSGTTEVWWDEQKTVRNDKGQVVLVCHQGHDWPSDIDGD